MTKSHVFDHYKRAFFYKTDHYKIIIFHNFSFQIMDDFMASCYESEFFCSYLSLAS